MTLKQMWRTLLGIDAEVQRASDAAYLEGFTAGLKTFQRTVRGPAYLAGFTEGRQSVRTVPLSESIDEEGPVCRSH